jgi:hypothetical protein
VQIMKLPLCNFLHSSITSSLLGPNIPLTTLFSNTLIMSLPQNWKIFMSRTHFQIL